MADLQKLVADLSALTILEASELKKMLEEAWGVTAASGGGMMMMAGAGAVAPVVVAEPVEEPTEFNVIIDDVGPKKINVIKAVRQLTSLGLKEAKDMVEADKPTVLEAVSKEKAEEARTVIEAEGAKVVIKPVV